MGQAKRLQSDSALSEAHAFPPLAAAPIMERAFVFVPVVPQDLEQAPLDQPETVQSTGQA